MILNSQLSYPHEIPLQGEFAILSHIERTILHNLISNLGNNTNIVEVGSALGGAACLMAAVNPTINVVCVEAFHNNIWSWENQIRPVLSKHIQNWCVMNRVNLNDHLFWLPLIDSCFEKDRSVVLAFNVITKQFPNIKLLQGESPTICADWSEPIDVYFEDAVHANPGLHSNIDFWIKHIKPNGMIVGHDYNDSCSDVKYEFNNLIQQGWSLISKVESLIVLQKPKGT
jgi:precorrin-6B methylase 2